MNKNLITIVLLISTFSSFSQIKTVGPFFPACNYGEIQTAINSGATEIRVVDGSYLENLSFQTSLTIKGGYATCADAVNDNQGTSQATIDGSNQDFPVISMINNSSRSTVVLENIILVNGNAVAVSGGGILLSDMDVDLSLKNVNINNNHSGLLGGGIAIRLNTVSASTDVSLFNTTVTNNTAPRGGGIYCSVANGSASITLRQASGLSSNSATSSTTGMGGGAYLENCTFTVYSGTNISTSDIGISSNTAVKEGGGIYARFGAFVSLYGHANCSGGSCIGDDDVNPINLTGNTASSGGALYLSGPSTYAEIFAGLINNNHSSLNGGAIAVMDNAILDVRRVTKECWDKVRCNFFDANTAATSGGAIYSESTNVSIKNTYFENNRALLGTAIYTNGATTVTKIDGSVFNHNGNNGIDYQDKYVIRAFFGSKLEIVQSTFADNNATTAVFGISNSSELKLYSSIVHDVSSGTITDSSDLGLFVVDCVIAHNLASVNLINAGGFIADPQFIDRNNRDYHINPFTSPAIDNCSPPLAPFLNKDIDFTERGWDNPLIDGSGDWFDVGADEAIIIAIFKDGFE